ncbi:MAG: quinate 5-dehydrogenase [Clostridiales bacterium]|nr:quinate 5-dehydrogenase [Clostridiales bacterium]
MKRIVSVSIGSSSRDHRVIMDIGGVRFSIERIGTNGDIKKAIALIESLDGKVDAFGLGGIDLYLFGHGGRRYVLKSALPLVNAARQTPIFDGIWIKDTIERDVVSFLHNECDITLTGKKTFIVSAMDRLGMAESFAEFDSQLIIGDLMFALGIPIPIYNIRTLHNIANVIMPVISRLPFKILYPTGEMQRATIEKFTKYYCQADIIAGDFLYIKKHMPKDMTGKIIVTNSITEDDVVALRERGVKLLVTSTPELEGRSFGTNVMEAMIRCIAGRASKELGADGIRSLFSDMGFKYRVEYL